MKLVDPTPQVDQYLELERQASAPYLDFVYDTPADGAAIEQFLWECAAGEHIPPYGALVVDGDNRAVAMLATLDHGELRRARTDAAMALVRGKRVDPRGPVRARMMLANETLLAVEPGDFYLSRIAVAAAARRRGIARWVMAEYERAGRARGLQRLVLEVSLAHVAALHLYEHCGFTVLAERRAHDPATNRELAYRHMMKAL